MNNEQCSQNYKKIYLFLLSFFLIIEIFSKTNLSRLIFIPIFLPMIILYLSIFLSIFISIILDFTKIKNLENYSFFISGTIITLIYFFLIINSTYKQDNNYYSQSNVSSYKQDNNHYSQSNVSSYKINEYTINDINNISYQEYLFLWNNNSEFLYIKNTPFKNFIDIYGKLGRINDFKHIYRNEITYFKIYITNNDCESRKGDIVFLDSQFQFYSKNEFNYFYKNDTNSLIAETLCKN